MAFKSLLHSDALAAYVQQTITKETQVQKTLRARTRDMPMGIMQLSADQGALLGLLIKISGAKRAIEIGTFTGYSALCIADALPEHGELICCDISEAWTAIARDHWEQAGLGHKIDLRIAPALETLDALRQERGPESFDFVFIDADKGSYDLYYEAALSLTNPGGVILLDNMLPEGVEHPPGQDDSDTTQHLRPLNAKIRDDARVDCALLTVGAGFMLVRKK